MLDYIKVTVPEHMSLAIAGAFIGIAISGGVIDINAFLAFASLMLLVGGFNTFNGVTDFKIDLINKPYRPIPSGKITRRNASLFSLLLYFVGLVIAFNLTPQYFVIYSIATILSILYSLPPIRLRKRFLINSFSVTILYGLLCPLAGWSLMPVNPVPIFMLIFLLLFGFGLSITRDFEDYMGDKIYSNKTIPVLFGTKGSVFITSSTLIVSFLYLFLSISMGLLNQRFVIIIILLPAFLFLIYKMYSNNSNSHFVNNKRRSRMIFNVLMSLGVLLEIILGVIALY
jgi:geranylgeranylglycerol-phosphate geranylgeranyltransferase